MSEDYERVFRIYLNNKESEAFTLKFYKHTSKQDMNIIIREVLSNFRSHYNNSNLKAWQDTEHIDIDFEKDLVRFKDSILLTEAAPSSEVTTERGTCQAINEDYHRLIDFHSPSTNQQPSPEQTPYKFEIHECGDDELPKRDLGMDLVLKNSFQNDSDRYEYEIIKRLSNGKSEEKPRKASNIFSDQSITFNPLKNHSFLVEGIKSSFVKSKVMDNKQSFQDNPALFVIDNQTEADSFRYPSGKYF